MAKSDIEMVVGQVIRIPVAVAADRILTRGKSILGAMRGPLERRAADQGVGLKRFRLTQDRERDCCVLEALVVEGRPCGSLVDEVDEVDEVDQTGENAGPTRTETDE